MGMELLGESFDIHCGGVDLVFPHHENEIAQSEAATGVPFVRHWFHSEHLLVDGKKMSKSLGNQYTVRELLDQGHRPGAIRYLLASVHYRQQLNFTLEGLQQAEVAIRRVEDFLRRAGAPVNAVGNGKVAGTLARFEAALDDDLNVSRALAEVFHALREGNRALGGTNGAGPEWAGAIQRMNRVLGVFGLGARAADSDSEAIDRLVAERTEARHRRDWAAADRIRDQLLERGIQLEDTPAGTIWRR